jgi:hypothetical protein
MTCIRCGLIRVGPVLRLDYPHQFQYIHPNGVVSPLIPPCPKAKSIDDSVVDDLVVCAECGEPPQGPGLPCPNGHNDSFKQIKSCRHV